VEGAREAIGREKVHLHDLRHSGLTWAAATGASTAELMKRGGHASPVAALRYQHATMLGDQRLAERLAALATDPECGAVEEMGHAGGTRLPDGTPIVPVEDNSPTEHAIPDGRSAPPVLELVQEKPPAQPTVEPAPLNVVALVPKPPNDASSPEDTEQSQRGSNPCLHLERVVS
jgi:hypothetical protein